MLRLNHPRFNTICVGRQERSKRQQSAAAHIRQALLLHLTAKTGVEHPLRNLQRSRPVQFVSHATENYTSASSRFGSNAYRLSIPWMPAIKHFSNAGFMGVLYPSCTTEVNRAPAQVREFRIRDRHLRPGRIATALKKRSESRQRPSWADFTMNMHFNEPPHSCRSDFCGPHQRVIPKLSQLIHKLSKLN